MTSLHCTNLNPFNDLGFILFIAWTPHFYDFPAQNDLTGNELAKSIVIEGIKVLIVCLLINLNDHKQSNKNAAQECTQLN